MSLSKSYRLHASSEMTFNAAESYLIVDGEKHHLEPLQSRMLMFFIDKRKEVISAQELADCVWKRKEVSENLVRQVISLLRTQLNDRTRPYQIIKTIPKQGYLLDIEVSEIETKETKPVSNNNSKSPNKGRLVGALLFLVIMVAGISAYEAIKTDKQDTIENSVLLEQGVVPLVFHNIVLDNSADYSIAKSVYEYIYFGLNSSKNIVGYRGEHLKDIETLTVLESDYELKSWMRRDGDGYVINLMLQFFRNKEIQTVKFEKYFTKDEFFSSIGDLILEIKTYMVPEQTDYNVDNHRITSIKNYQDWEIIARAISLFYQGKGATELEVMENELKKLKNSGRSYYLLDSLSSYISTMKFLNDRDESNRQLALLQAEEAFEQNPRCNIANTTLGMALLLNNEVEKAYPYLFFAAESSPSPVNYYLLGVADEQVDNQRGAEYNYQRFSELNKAGIGQVREIQEYLQNPNLSKPILKK